MGGGPTTSAVDWGKYSASVKATPVDRIYTSRELDPYLDPKGITVRESRDSVAYPNSTAIIAGLDVTGSMGDVLEDIAKHGLETLFTEIFKRKPVPDPQIAFAGIGDVRHDASPFQISQFEVNDAIIEQLTKIYLERGGGGNSSESYDATWYFAAKHTSIDCFEKRGKKGYLFTFGDEDFPYGLESDHIKTVFGDDTERSYSAIDLLRMAEQQYHVFHIIIGHGYRGFGGGSEEKTWKAVMGQRAILLNDYHKLAETIISLIQVNEGENKDVVADSWDGSTSVIIRDALKDFTGALANVGNKKTGIVKF